MTRKPLLLCALCLVAGLPVAAQVTAKAGGLAPAGVSCRNLTTGQDVVSTAGETVWDCSALGLQFDPGDQVEVGIRGLRPPAGPSGPFQAPSLLRDFVSQILEVDSVEISIGQSLPGDLDDDGDLDVVLADRFGWLENLGGRDPEFVIHTLDGPIGDATALLLIDVNLDQRLDVVAGFPVQGQLLWFRNDGGSPPTFTSRSIDRRLGGWNIKALDGGDLDGDGDTDLFASTDTNSCCNLEEIVWFENSDTGWVRHLIAQGDFGVSWIFAFDADGDQDLDLVHSETETDTLSWFENQAGSFTQKHLIQEGVFGHYNTAFGDLDGDGDRDLVGYQAGVDQLLWFENLGGGDFAAAELIEQVPGHWLHGLLVADFTADGRSDILIGDDERVLTWFENLGGSPPTFERHDVSVESRSIIPVVADINGDRRPDLIYADHGKFVWQQNRLGLRLSVTGLDVSGFHCRNRTTGRTVRPPSVEPEVDCEAAGLRVSAGDEISVFASGLVQ